MGRQLVLDSYARESRRGDRRNMSITGQHDENGERITRLGAQLGERLDDKGKSAWLPGVERPDWEKLIKRVEAGESDGCVIWQLSRFLRRVEDAVRIVKVAERGFKVYDSDMEYDLTTVGGREAFYNQAVSNETYSGRISENVQRGHRLKVRRGEGRTGARRPFGFDHDPIRHAIAVNPIERDYIRHIVAKILAKEWNWEDAARYLTAEDVLTSAGNAWVGINLRNAVRAPRMAGLLLVNGEVAGRMEGEPILDETTWQKVLAHVAYRKGRPVTGAYLCSGKDMPITCECGERIRGRSDTHGRRYVDDESPEWLKEREAKELPGWEDLPRKREYMCQRASGGCGRHLADQRTLELIVEGIALRIMSSPDYPTQVQRALRVEHDLRAPIMEEIRGLEDLIAYWDGRLAKREIGTQRHLTMASKAEQELADAQERLAGLPALDARVADEDAANTAASDWNSAERTVKKEMLREALRFGSPNGDGLTIVITPGSALDTDIENVGRRIEIRRNP